MASIEKVTGTDDFFNSGVLDCSKLSRDRMDFLDLGKVFGELVRPGRRLNPTLLNMPRDSLSLPPHCHPGGEIAYVVEGEYFDSDMKGNLIRNYGPGSIVVYGIYSTHRPLSKIGARIFYVPFDGIIFPGKSSELQAEDAISLLTKMQAFGSPAPGEAIDYARSWMLND